MSDDLASGSIDVHAHYLSRRSLETASASAQDGLAVESTSDGVIVRVEGNSYGPLPGVLSDPDGQIEALAERRVSHAVLSPPPFLFCYGCEPTFAEAFAEAQNEGIAELVRAGNGAFTGLGTVPLQQPQRAAACLSKAMALGLVGVEIGTNVDGKDLDDPSLEPFWQCAAELDALVFIHPSDVRGVPFTAPYYLRNLLGNPLETANALARLIFGGVIERHPGLRILAAHAGGSLPYTIGRFDRGYACRPECRVALDQPPSTYLKRFWFDSISHAAPALRYLVDLVGADRVALGSDFPFDMGDPEPLAHISELPPTQREQVTTGTARSLLRLGGRA